MTNSENCNMQTIHSSELHLPQTKLAIFQKGVYISGVKIFNNLPSDVKNTLVILRDLSNIKTFFDYTLF
jgi:hypothetical protein